MKTLGWKRNIWQLLEVDQCLLSQGLGVLLSPKGRQPAVFANCTSFFLCDSGVCLMFKLSFLQERASYGNIAPCTEMDSFSLWPTLMLKMPLFNIYSSAFNTLLNTYNVLGSLTGGGMMAVRQIGLVFST